MRTDRVFRIKDRASFIWREIESIRRESASSDFANETRRSHFRYGAV